MLNETLVNSGDARWIWLKEEYEWTHNLQVPESLVASVHMVNNFKQYSSDVENEHEESSPLYAAVTEIMGYLWIWSSLENMLFRNLDPTNSTKSILRWPTQRLEVQG